MTSLTLQDLHQVVPEPVEPVVPNTPKQPPFLKRIISILTKVQKYSAYTFLGFFGLHIASTVVVPGLGVSADRCQEVFEMCRNVYMGPVFEYLFIYGAAGLHLGSGMLLRIARLFKKYKRQEPHDLVIRDAHRDDIGLGGLGTLVGLGFKRSWISTHFPAFTPLTFSGYVMAAALAYHWAKMRWAPMCVDGDSTLITLLYVTHYLHQSPLGRWGNTLNWYMLTLLAWVSFYHIVSGLFKYRRQLGARAKKIAYGVIGTFTTLALISVSRMARWPLDTGYLGSKFAAFLKY